MVLVALLAFGAVSCETPNEPVDKPTPEVKPEDGKPVVLEDFTVTLTALHSGDVSLNIEPENKEMKYWYSLQLPEDMPETDEEILAADLDYLKYVADYYGMSLSELLSTELKAGDLEWRYVGLEPNTEYVLYMYGISIEGNALTGVNKLTFKTTKVMQLDCTFDILPGDNITANSFSVTIIPSDDTVGYYYEDRKSVV